MRQVKHAHPFIIHAWVILPEHMHCIIELPEGDANFALRWRLIKLIFSRALPDTESHCSSKQKRGERGIWQRRYWEHLIRDQTDFSAHMDYVHFNPVKRGWVHQVSDWPYSTFHLLVKQGVYSANWAGGENDKLYPD